MVEIRLTFLDSLLHNQVDAIEYKRQAFWLRGDTAKLIFQINRKEEVLLDCQADNKKLKKDLKELRDQFADLDFNSQRRIRILQMQTELTSKPRKWGFVAYTGAGGNFSQTRINAGWQVGVGIAYIIF